jgi:hypothetical protein
MLVDKEKKEGNDEDRFKERRFARQHVAFVPSIHETQTAEEDEYDYVD